MPTYDYKCKACGNQFEHFQSMKDSPLRKCPKCGKLALERLIGTGAAVLFKGSGFYQTDYRSDAYNKAAKADSDAAKPAATAASTDSATKPVAPVPAPAAKPEPKPASDSGAKPSKPNKSKKR